MKKSLFRPCLLWTLLSLLLLAPAAWGTRDPWVEISIRPVAVNEQGKVLFKTMTRQNQSGGSGSSGWELGFLVVSSKGVWEEQLFFEESSYNYGDKYYEQHLKAYEETKVEFRGYLDWNKIPPGAKQFLGKYRFSEKDAISPEMGKGELMWGRQGIGRGKSLITGPIRQRTLWNNLSENKGSNESRVPCTFYFRGVALFHNIQNPISANGNPFPEVSDQGARFDISDAEGAAFFPRDGKVRKWDPNQDDAKDARSDTYFKSIDGICIVPEK